MNIYYRMRGPRWDAAAHSARSIRPVGKSAIGNLHKDLGLEILKFVQFDY